MRKRDKDEALIKELTPRTRPDSVGMIWAGLNCILKARLVAFVTVNLVY